MLSPGAQGEINFSIPVKDVIPVSGSKDKNFSFSAIARMDSPDIPTPEGANKVIASNSVNVKLNSKLLASLEGFFNDADIVNSGPIPPKVGQESTFTLHLKIANVSNDVTDAKVAMTLAPGVKWKNNFLPKDASMSYNDRTNELDWNVGSLGGRNGCYRRSQRSYFSSRNHPVVESSRGFCSRLFRKRYFPPKILSPASRSK